MLYAFVKWSVRLALQFYCRDLLVQGIQKAGAPGPVLLCSNHPNSFFDAIIIGACFPRPVHFLARGDAFARPWAARLLRSLQLIPIYRLSEGRENLNRNETSFAECLAVLEKGGAVLIFPEGLCVQEWALRPLKKGAARLSCLACEQVATKELCVQPLGLYYSSFTAVPKTVSLTAGKPFFAKEIAIGSEAHFYQQFNTVLEQCLEPLINAPALLLERLHKSKLSAVSKILIAVPAGIGALLHYPFFKALQRFAQRKTAGSVFYDSVLFALLYLLYPPAVLLLAGMVVWATGESVFWALLIGIPFCGWCWKRWKALSESLF